ncbi:MAG: ATPase [Microcoleus vaginatus WJT46-NPBG5]|jgi:N-acetylglucosamine kinase|nr:ATPase [Microcoleus vaginatus WJT46-NPBG5]
MKGCVLGIDGGGTKTVCILMDKTGQAIGRGEAGPSNYQTVGLEAAGNSIRDAIAQAAAPLGEVSVEAICVGLAGVGRSQDVQAVRGLVQQLLSSSELPVKPSLQLPSLEINHQELSADHLLHSQLSILDSSRVIVCNDSAIALVGGVGKPVGVVIIAGTGAIAFGQNHQGQTKRASGWGYLLGDEGSGYHIAIRGLSAVVRSYDGRLGETILTERITKHLNLNSIEDLVEVIYRRGWGVKQIAALAPIIDEAAAAGDLIANNIINEAVEELVLAARVVSQALFKPEETFEVVTMGGVWRGVANLRGRFATSLAEIIPSATVIWAKHEPAYGAALLAMQTSSPG